MARKLVLKTKLQFFWRDVKDLAAAKDDGVGEGGKLRNGIGGFCIWNGFSSPAEEGFERVLPQEVLKYPHRTTDFHSQEREMKKSSRKCLVC